MKAWYPAKRDAPLIDRRIQRIKKGGFRRKYRPTSPKKRRDRYTRRLGKLGKTKGSGGENKRERLRVARYTRNVHLRCSRAKRVFTRLAKHTREHLSRSYRTHRISCAMRSLRFADFPSVWRR